MNEKDKEANPFLDTSLGFGINRDVKISDFDISNGDYLLWALKNVRIPKPLWNAILEQLDTMIILNTHVCVINKNDIPKEELEKSKDQFKLNHSLFLEPRIDPDIKYLCESCNSETYGIPSKGYVSDEILCEYCENQLKLEAEEMRFYFGWYKGWRIKDFEIKEDKEYLKWIIDNLEGLLSIILCHKRDIQNPRLLHIIGHMPL